MHLIKAIFILAILLPGAGAGAAWARWQLDGSNLDYSEVTNYAAMNPSLAFLNTTPYVAWEEYNGTAYQIYVKHYNGAAWQADGAALNYDTAQNATTPVLAVHNGVLYAAWSEVYSANATMLWVKYLNGSVWQHDGGALTLDSTFTMKSIRPSLAASSTTRYAAWAEGNTYTAYQIYVKANSGSGWQLRGGSLNQQASRTANYPCLALDNDVPYVAWSEGNTYTPAESQIYVKHWNNGAWQPAGGSLNVDPLQSATMLSLAVYQGRPYVAWVENRQLYVKSFNGTSWSLLGSGSLNVISDGSYVAATPRIKLSQGVPYVAWAESSNMGFAPLNKSYVKYWDGSGWQLLGNVLVNSGHNDYQPALEITGGVPYVAWVETTKNVDFYRNHKVYLKHYIPGISRISPEYGYAGRTTAITVQAEAFARPPILALVSSSGSVIASGPATSTTAASYASSFQLPGAAPGVYDMRITANNSTFALKQAFSILALQVPVGWTMADLGAVSSMTITSQPAKLVVGDADQDNLQEIYIANGGASLLRLKKFSYGWNSQALPQASGAVYQTLCLADGNGDQAWEIYGGLSDGHLVQLRGTEWVQADWGGTSPAGSGLHAVAAADMDDDGLVEVYAAGDDGAVWQYANTSTAIFKSTLPGSPASRAYALACGDGNRDLKLELYSANADQRIYQYACVAGVWQVTQVGLGAGDMHDVVVADGDNDGHAEVYAACQDGKIYQYRWNGASWSSQTVGAGSGAMRAVAVSDGDTDGFSEVYAACVDGHVYQFRYSAGQWVVADLGGTGSPLAGLAIGDADNEHHFEVYALAENNHLFRFAAIPAATPTPTPTIDPSHLSEADKQVRVFRSQINPCKGEQARIRWYQSQETKVTLKVYNLMGDPIITLADQRVYAPGAFCEVLWDGKDRDGRHVGSGLYIVHLEAGDQKSHAKIAVVK